MELTILPYEKLDEFKRLMQESFQQAYEEAYGKSNEQILPEADIDECLNKSNSHAYAMMDNENIIGGAIIEINEKTQHNALDFLFISISCQNKGIGQKIWNEIERLHPNTEIWQTCTPYFDKRNIHFYVNKLKFHIVEFHNENHPDPNAKKDHPMDGEEMFLFEKIMKH